jgi:hypothetical protein
MPTIGQIYEAPSDDVEDPLLPLPRSKGKEMFVNPTGAEAIRETGGLAGLKERSRPRPMDEHRTEHMQRAGPEAQFDHRELGLITPEEETWFQMYDPMMNAWVGASVNAHFTQNLIGLYRIQGISGGGGGGDDPIGEGKEREREREREHCFLDVHRIAYSKDAYLSCFSSLATASVAEGAGSTEPGVRGRQGGGSWSKPIGLYAVTDSRLAARGEDHVVATIWMDPKQLGDLQISRRIGCKDSTLDVDSKFTAIVKAACLFADVEMLHGEAMTEHFHSLYHVIHAVPV